MLLYAIRAQNTCIEDTASKKKKTQFENIALSDVTGGTARPIFETLPTMAGSLSSGMTHLSICELWGCYMNHQLSMFT